ncbi:hypothetical protein [Streptomyces sp. NPDC003395]
MSTEARHGARPLPGHPATAGTDSGADSASDADPGSASGSRSSSSVPRVIPPRFPLLRPGASGGDAADAPPPASARFPDDPPPPPASARFPDGPPPPPASARFPDTPPTVGRGSGDPRAGARAPEESPEETTARLRPVPAAPTASSEPAGGASTGSVSSAGSPSAASASVAGADGPAASDTSDRAERRLDLDAERPAPAGLPSRPGARAQRTYGARSGLGDTGASAAYRGDRPGPDPFARPGTGGRVPGGRVPGGDGDGAGRPWAPYTPAARSGPADATTPGGPPGRPRSGAPDGGPEASGPDRSSGPDGSFGRGSARGTADDSSGYDGRLGRASTPGASASGAFDDRGASPAFGDRSAPRAFGDPGASGASVPRPHGGNPGAPGAAGDQAVPGHAPDPALSWTSEAGPARPRVSLGQPEFFDDHAHRGPARLRRHSVAAAVCLVLGLGLIGGAVTGAWLTGDSDEAGTAGSFAATAGLWHNVPVDQLFPPTVSGPGAGPGGADRTWTRVAVAPDGGCADAFDPLLRKALAPVGCGRLLRATYTDATQSYVTTVGLLFTKADPAGMRALNTRFRTEALGTRPDLMPRPYAAADTPAAGFGDPQRASWTIHVLTDAPVVVYAVTGWADGRSVDAPQPAGSRSGATTAPLQAGLGNEAQGLADRIEKNLRRTAHAPTETSS